MSFLHAAYKQYQALTRLTAELGSPLLRPDRRAACISLARFGRGAFNRLVRIIVERRSDKALLMGSSLDPDRSSEPWGEALRERA